ncbi:hypothetical protein [Novosphingobium sp. CECT 9465]|uniref:hypothetical protein n=1 Tax=Novosphingobium sp. CECT 9465 TaxID=2829794 RepID=UPI001E30AB04|nr:hypothetical protein [Novosphingobium sp. CECT 9465]CAH0498167.1 hypothetical protein NVSP9465_03243 [Novosphingobium sp. CECT 9465]
MQSQLQAIAQLQRQIGTADASSLATLQSSVAGMVAQIQVAAQLGRAAATGAEATEGAERAMLAASVAAQANAFMHDLRQYDHLLQFDSDEDRAAYAQREADRRRRYDEEMAKGTPEGQFHAGGEALGQMADVAAHGGSADPALMPRMNELAANLTKLREQMPAAEVEKFDQRRRDDLRDIMRSKGKSDAEIDAFLAAHPDPIEATKTFVTENAANVSVKELDSVRRQNIRHNSRRKLAECGPRLGVDVRRRACGVASADVRWSVA